MLINQSLIGELVATAGFVDPLDVKPLGDLTPAAAAHSLNARSRQSRELHVGRLESGERATAAVGREMSGAALP